MSHDAPAPAPTITNADSVPRREFIAALNDAYSDYYVPIHVSGPFFRDMLRRESIRLELSAAAVHEGTVVGTGMLGVRGQRGWIGGMGVVPGWRRRGIGRRMMQHLITQARAQGLHTLQLEVITQNEGAYHLYEGLGFETRRTLHVMVCSLHQANGRAAPLSVGKIPAARAVEAYAHLPHPEPPWQRELEHVPPRLLRTLAATHNDAVTGLLAYVDETLGLSLQALAATTPEAGACLLNALFDRNYGAKVTYLNVPTDDPMLPMLRASGFTTTITQYEMLLTLPRQ